MIRCRRSGCSADATRPIFPYRPASCGRTTLDGGYTTVYAPHMGQLLLAAERAEICAYARRMSTDRLVVGTSGNISRRTGDLVVVTPTGIDYAELTPESITVLDLTGRRIDGDLPPTSETPLHLALYQRKPVNAVVHTHAVHATAVSLLVDRIPPVHYLLGIVGGAVHVARYATFGTDELA